MAVNQPDPGGQPPQKPKAFQPKFTATRMVMAYLNDLRKTGLYGTKVSSVIAYLVTIGIERLIKDGILKRRDHPPADSDLTEDDPDG